MPELPEVESIRRGLARARLTAPIVEVWRSDKALRTGAHWRREELELAIGATPRQLTRRGKFLVWSLDGSRGPVGVLVHLGMTGRIGIAKRGDPLEPHTHVRVRFADDRELRFVDPRRFGGMVARPLHDLVASPPLSTLGPEPLARGFDGEVLQARAGRSARALHDVLLDQSVVAGVGNIYAQEALFLAGLPPLCAARRLLPSAWSRLADAVRVVLRQGVTHGGTTLRDYRDAEGRRGRNQTRLAVYGRTGEPCVRCGTTLRGYVSAGRSGAFCPTCQPSARRRRVP